MALLAIGIVIWELRSNHAQNELAQRSQTQTFVRAIEANVLYSIHFADLSLVSFSNAIKLLPADKRELPATIKALLASRSNIFADDFWNIYIDAKGKGVATSNDLAVGGISYLDRDYFKFHLENQGQGLFVGAPVTGKASKQKVFFISRRVESSDGKFLGVIAAPINAERFGKIFEDSRFNTNVTIALLHRDGKIIARAPDFESSFARDVSEADLFQHVQSQSEGTYRGDSKVDQLERVYSYRALAGMPLIVAVGITQLGVDRSFIVSGLGLLLMIIVMILSAQLALRTYQTQEERQCRFRKLYDASRATELKLQESEKRLRTVTNNLPILIGHIDQNERFTFANEYYVHFFGIAYHLIPGMRIVDVIGQQTYELSQDRIKAALRGETMHFDRCVKRHDRTCWDSVTYVPDKNSHGVTIGIFVTVEDITERKQAEESRLLASLVYEHTSEGMMITNPDGTIVTVNASFSRLSGYRLDEVIGKHLSELASERHDEEFFNQIRKSIGRTGQWAGEIWNRHKNGDNYLISINFNSVYDDAGKVVRRVALFSDITKKKETEELIWKQANFDGLTGLPNRRLFHEHLRMEMKKTDRSNLPMALIFIDLDHFKEINDTLGHDLGDTLLKEAAHRLSVCIRGTDTVSRLGGDEFTIILSELKDAADPVRIAEALLASMIEPFKLGDNQAYISASIGITLYPDDGDTVDILLKNADQAMYSAKDQGRNRYNYFAPFMQEASQARSLLTAELRNALQGEQLRVLYQSIVDLKTGDVHKAEALVRWQHPTRGLLSPGDFLGVAETSGLILQIGDWVFRQAAAEVKRLQEVMGGEFQVCVNKSAMQFRDGGIQYEEWLAYLAEIGLKGSSVIIEVTEELLEHANSTVTDHLLACRDVGMQVSLDDFGRGYSSLSFMKSFDIDYLKIDPSFVSSLQAGSDGVILCEAIILMAHKLDMKVVAEGIETEEQLELLTKAGCDFGQGYLFSKPVYAEELEEMLLLRRQTVDKALDIHRMAC
ncbi:MAG: EAL domain-containing protein [Pseudomonadota bacterium]